jgi:hypothetical protein
LFSGFRGRPDSLRLAKFRCTWAVTGLLSRDGLQYYRPSSLRTQPIRAKNAAKDAASGTKHPNKQSTRQYFPCASRARPQRLEKQTPHMLCHTGGRESNGNGKERAYGSGPQFICTCTLAISRTSPCRVPPCKIGNVTWDMSC